MDEQRDVTHAIAKAKQDAYNGALIEADLTAQLKDRRISTEESFRLLRRLDKVRTKRMEAEATYKALTERANALPLQESEMPPIYIHCHLHTKGNNLVNAAVQWIDKEMTKLAALCPHCIEEGRKLAEDEKKRLGVETLQDVIEATKKPAP